MTSAPQLFRRDLSGSRRSQTSRLPPGRKGRRGCWHARRGSAACGPPIEALTLTFLKGQVHASLVVSDDGAWERIACGEEAAEDAGIEHRERTFLASELPTRLTGWQAIFAAIAEAKSCRPDNPDGASDYHFAFGAGLDSFCVRCNLTQTANALERQTIVEYATIKALL
jgi:hypothetical protein